LIVKQTHEFEKDFKKIDKSLKLKLKKKIKKIIEFPLSGKPLKHLSKVFSERLEGHRLIYEFKENKILLICFKNRNDVYAYLQKK
jgi:mRNA-degrading endonuclease RelE of RelBE toxin-antitoxin system